jgi:hypothetical protein
VPVSSLSSFVNRLIGDATVEQPRSAASVELAPSTRNSLGIGRRSVSYAAKREG